MAYCYHCMAKIDDDSAVFCPECGKKCREHFARSEELPAGTVIGNGRYLVGKSLGSGGFGITYIGRDLNINKKVVIKETFYSGLFSRNCYDTSRSDRFKAEYSDISFEKIMKKTCKECESIASAEGLDNIVKVYDYFFENNTSYIVTEFIDGSTLTGRVENFGRYSWSELYKRMKPLMESLAELHGMGILHRDIKPDNIMLKSSKRFGEKFVLIDFGLARSSSTQTTVTTGLAFSPGYSPFEQRTLSGEDGTFIDVYALSATIYFALTGENPNTKVSDDIDKNFPRLAFLSSEYGVPEKVVDGLRKALNPNFKNRTQNVDDLIEEFENSEDSLEEGVSHNSVSDYSDLQTQKETSVNTTDTVVADDSLPVIKETLFKSNKETLRTQEESKSKTKESFTKNKKEGLEKVIHIHKIGEYQNKAEKDEYQEKDNDNLNSGCSGCVLIWVEAIIVLVASVVICAIIADSTSSEGWLVLLFIIPVILIPIFTFVINRFNKK